MANQVELNLLFEIKDAVKNLNSFTKQAEKSASSLENIFTGIGIAAAAFVGVFTTGKIIGFFEEAVHASAEAEAALNQLNSSLAIAGNLVPGASAAFQSFAETMQETTTIEDDAIIKTGALIESLTQLDEKGLEQATLAAVNLSAAIGIDLDSAARLVSKSVEGNTDALKRYGIAIKAGINDAQTLANTVEALNDKFGGAAAAQVLTYSGAVTQAKNSFGDILESIGDVITHNSAVIVVINKAAEAFRIIKKFIDENKTSISALIREGIIGLIQTLPSLIGLLDIVNNSFLKIQQGANFLKKGLNVVTGFIAQIGKTNSEFKEIADSVSKDNEALDKNTSIAEKNAASRSESIKELVDNAKKFVDQTEKEINLQTKSGNEFLKNNDKKIKGLKELTEAQIRAAKEEAERIQRLSTLKFDLLAGNFNVNLVLPKDTKGQIALGLGGLDKVLEGAKGATELIASGAGAIANTLLPGIGEAIKQMVTVFAQGPEKVRAMIDEFFQAIPKIIQNVILSIPAVIQGFIENLPKFINALVASIPIIIDGLLNGIPSIIDSIVASSPLIIQGLVEQIPLVIQSLVDGIPAFIQALVASIPSITNAFIAQIPTISVSFAISLASQAPFIATTFAVEFIKQIPTIATGIAKAIPEAVKQFIGGAGGLGQAASGAGQTLGKLFGFADGGTIQIPRGDNMIAGFNDAETVVDKSTTDELKLFLAQQRQSQNSGQPLTINLQIGESQIAQVLLNLNRQGFRTV